VLQRTSLRHEDSPVHTFDTSYFPEEARQMSETVSHDQTDEVTDEAREARDEASRTAERAKSEAAEGVDRVKDGAGDAADKVSDVVEDMIPGDSDRDGH
jgi:hypothetical protein